MGSDDIGGTGLKPRSPPEVARGAKGVRANVVFCCPECGASFRLVSCSTVATNMRQTQTAWPPAPQRESELRAQPKAVARLSDEHDEPTGGHGTPDEPDSASTNPELASPDDLEDVDTQSFIPARLAEYRVAPSQLSLDPKQLPSVPTTATATTAPISACSMTVTDAPSASPTPESTISVNDRNPPSDVPLTREAYPELRRKSRGGILFAIGSGILALSVLVALHQLMQPVGSQSRNSAAIVPVSPAVIPAPPTASPQPNGDAPATQRTDPVRAELGLGEATAATTAAPTQDRLAKPGLPLAETPIKVGAAQTTQKSGSTMAQTESEDPAIAKRNKTASAKTEEKAIGKTDDEATENVEAAEPIFDAVAAAEALDSAAARSGACRQVDDPSGVAVVTVTFAPSGRVTTATIAGPPFANTPTGSCIAKKMRTATIPKFSGSFVTVKRTVTVN